MSNQSLTPADGAVVALGYLGFKAKDVGAWRTWATQVFGLEEVDGPRGAPADHLYLRMDDRGWRFAVEPGDTGELLYTGWEVSSPEALDKLEKRLADAGVRVERDTELARRRNVEDLVRCRDPSGFQLEFFCGGFIPRQPFVSPLGVKFVTGDMGLGHILLMVEDAEATRRFYFDLLGFRLTDFIEFGPNKVHFTRVNPRHHSLAFVQARGRPAQLGHFMVEVGDVDAVGRALDKIHSGMGRVTETLGRHTNDLMLSFYCENPSGSQAEYGCGGRVIDESNWTVTTYDATAFWGHKVPGSEYSAAGPLSPREETK